MGKGREKAHAEQHHHDQHDQQVFATAAARLWEQLCRVIEQKARALNKASVTTPQTRVGCARTPEGALVVGRTTYPLYLVELVLDTEARQIVAKQKWMQHATSPSIYATVSLALDLDPTGKTVVMEHQGTPLSLEQVAELMVRPLLER